MHILIADDDPIALAVLRHTLEQDGHEVDECRDGAEALCVLREDRHRLLISDWVMPQLDGIELTRKVRSEEFPSYIYVILLTSKHGAQRVVEGISAGADDFLSKPFDPDELRVRVRAAERVLSLETRDLAIFAMAKLAESRDPETGAHLERVREYSRLLADSLWERRAFPEEMDEDFSRLIYLASPLHDIGKVGIPDSILLRPGRLNDREFEIMKTHTTIGAETLDAAVRKFPGVRLMRMARDIALTHHERFDGSGYPAGLSGRDIPICGRVVALADVYDALTSKRVYKQAFAHEIAYDMIVAEAGKQFDPEIVEVFASTQDQFTNIHERYAEECAVV